MNGPVIVKIEKLPRNERQEKRPKKISLKKWTDYIKGKKNI